MKRTEKQTGHPALLPEDVIHARIRRFEIRASLWNTLMKLLLILAALYLLLTVFYGIAIVPDEGVKPSLRQGDLAVFDRLSKNPEVTDVVACVDEGQPRFARVVARSGDTVDIHEEGQLIVNGQARARENQAVILSERGSLDYPVKLAPDELFLLNDKDENTTDSRTLAPLPAGRIRGKLLLIIRRRSF